MRHLFLALTALLLVGLASTPVWSADRPRLPAQKDSKPAEGTVRLGNVLDFTPPEGWEVAKNATTPTRAAYVSKDRQAMMSIELLPASMKIEPSLAADMIKKMRQNRQANSQKYVDEPKVEKDEKYIIRIRERYQIKDKVADQLHLYRAVGPRFLLVTVNSLAGEEKAGEHHAAGENASMSAAIKQ